MSEESTETKTAAAERRELEAQRKAEQEQDRKRLIRLASADLHKVVGGMLQQGLTWSDITVVLKAAAASAEQQQSLEK